MKLEEAYNLAKALTEERNGGENDGFKVQLGENEGDNIPHFHQNNWENLRNMWNNYYPQAKVSCNQIDYSNLCKDYKQR